MVVRARLLLLFAGFYGVGLFAVRWVRYGLCALGVRGCGWVAVVVCCLWVFVCFGLRVYVVVLMLVLVLHLLWGFLGLVLPVSCVRCALVRGVLW